MKYWWVNQKQTYRHEKLGGYIWSPKLRQDGYLNHFYENMKLVSPGDVVFSYRDARIVSVGRVTSFCYDSPRPTEYGMTGLSWHESGWKWILQDHT